MTRQKAVQAVPTAPEDRQPHYRDAERREQAAARAGAYPEKWWDDEGDIRALEQAERALREALGQSPGATLADHANLANLKAPGGSL